MAGVRGTVLKTVFTSSPVKDVQSNLMKKSHYRAKMYQPVEAFLFALEAPVLLSQHLLQRAWFLVL